MCGLFFALALTLLGLFCFHHFPKMIVLRGVVAHSVGMARNKVSEMIVLRRVVAHWVKPNNVRKPQNFSYNRSL